MYIIAITLVLAVGVVLLAKGVDALPYGWIGAAVAGVLAVAAIAMTRLHFDDAH